MEKLKNIHLKQLVGIGVFALVALLILAVTQAGTTKGKVYLEARGSSSVALKTDSNASGTNYIEFGNSTGGGGLAKRTDFPIRNTAIDSRTQYVNTPSDQIPRSEFIQPRAGLQGATWGLGNFVGTSKQLGQFTTQCTFSHYAYDDPIVFPGEKGAAHLHMFFGNTLANADSTYDSLLNSGSSTCNGLEGNRTAYWAPAVFDADGNLRIPTNIELYYKSHSGGGGGVNLTNNDFPDNLAFIGGDASGAGIRDAAIGNVSEWGCYNGAITANQNRVVINLGRQIPNCPAGYQLLNHIYMPYCLRGDANDSINNTSQLSYPPGGYWSGSCPGGTTELTAVEVFIVYGAEDRTPITNNWFIASDVQADGSIKPGGTTSHTDWFGAWNRELFSGIFEGCISRLAWCYWDTIGPNEALKRITHYGPNGAASQYYYNGRKTIPAEEVSRLLCPKDTYTKASDAANCENP